MAHFELHYPNEGAPTASFVPESCPLLEGYEVVDDDNTLADLMADGISLTVYRIGDPSQLIVVPFELSTADKAAWDAFKEAVRGKAFRLKHEPMTTTFVDARIAPEGFHRRWSVPNSGQWRGTLAFWII